MNIYIYAAISHLYHYIFTCYTSENITANLVNNRPKHIASVNMVVGATHRVSEAQAYHRLSRWLISNSASPFCTSQNGHT